MCAAFSPDSELLCRLHRETSRCRARVLRHGLFTGAPSSDSGARKGTGEGSAIAVKSVGFTLDGTAVCSAGSDGVGSMGWARDTLPFRGARGEVTCRNHSRNGTSALTEDAARSLVAGDMMGV